MTEVRIVHAEPWPGRLPEAGFAISQFLVLLGDDAGRRALAVWLNGIDGDALWQILGQPARGAGMAGTAEELTGRLLQAAGVAVTGVDISELDTETTVPPRLGSAPRPLAEARIALGTRGGTRQVTARLGFGLALAAAAGAPVRVADAVLDRLAVAIEDGELVRQFSGLPAPAVSRPRPRLRFEPRNLTFADGLNRWGFGGSFLREGSESHGGDYSCRATDRSVIIRSAVPEPYGFAGLQQMIAADDYRGRTIVFSGELRTEDVADRAGLHLMVGPPLGPVGDDRPSPPRRATVTVAGSQDWTRHEVTADVPDDAGIVGFGFFLTGRGLVELRDAELTSGG
jgi:bifunctional DNase/RNase